MGKIATSWQLMKDSWHVLMRDKALVLFPLASAIACFLVLLTFILPWLGAGVAGWREMFSKEDNTVLYIVVFFYYLCNFFVIVFFNAALVDFVVTRMRGGEPTLGDSLRAAVSCLPQIAAWSVISATVGVLLQWLSQRVGFLGRIAISLVGVAWALVTFFVVPFLVVERKGALEAIGSSKDLLKKTWGEQLAGGVGFGLIGFLLTLPAIVVIVASIVGIAATQGQGWELWGALAGAGVLYVAALCIVMSTLRAIFGAVLYLYAGTGKVPAGFDEQDLRGAIKLA